MKFRIIIYGILVCHTLYSISNPKIPAIELKKHFQVTDESGDFYFKYPSSPIIDPQGFIYVADQNQLLRFSPSGKFLGNFYKRGQGPGEMTYLTGILVEKDQIMVFNRHPHKIIQFNTNGKLQKEILIAKDLGYAEFLTFFNNRYYFLKEQFHYTKGKAIITKIPVKLLSISINDITPRFENLSFPKKYFLRDTNYIQNLHYVQIGQANDHIFFIANNGNYDIKRLDLQNLSLVPFLKKSYPKTKIKKAWRQIIKPIRFPYDGISGKENKTFIRDAIDDVQRIFVVGRKIWILTSKFNEKTRLVHVDVYDLSGQFKGIMQLKMPFGFYLFCTSYTPMTIHKNEFYIFETNENGDKKLCHYHLQNLPAWAN